MRVSASTHFGLHGNGTESILRTMLVERSPSTVFTALDDGTGVLLSLETLLYYSLNSTGVAVWREIELNSPRAVDLLVIAICKRFDVDEERARRGIVAFVTRLAEFKMIRIV